MCGVGGIVSSRKIHEEAIGSLKSMVAQLRPRGPDDVNIHCGRQIAVAFSRLAINGKDNGRQPFRSRAGDVSVWVNGEIYNSLELIETFNLKSFINTKSDCEVVLHLYEQFGVDFVKHLNGDFAICIYDQRKRKVFLIRDRLGIRPLFYFRKDHELIFASEVKSLLQHPDCPREVDWSYNFEAHMGIWGYFPEKKFSSYFKNIESVQPGSIASIDLDSKTLTLQETSYWNFDAIVARGVQDGTTDEECVRAYSELVVDAVHKRLPSGGDPSALFLSGGMDSGSIAAISKSRGHDFHTYTVNCPSTRANGDAMAAHENSQRLGLQNTQLHFDGAWEEAAPLKWKEVVWASETPHCAPEAYYKYFLYKKVREMHPQMKIVFSGSGSDEFGCGYYSRWLNRAGILQQDNALESFSTAVHRVAQGGAFINGQIRESSAELRTWDLIFKKTYAYTVLPAKEANPISYYMKANFFSLQIWNLWFEDRIAFANGFENRLPYLDHRIVEFLWTLPDDKRESLWLNKTLLKKSMRHLLPMDVNQYKKINFYGGEKGLPHVVDFMHKLLSHNNEELVQEAIDSDPHGRIDKDVFLKLSRTLEDRPFYRVASSLLNVVNILLLEAMAREQRAKTHVTPDIPVFSLEASGESLYISLTAL